MRRVCITCGGAFVPGPGTMHGRCLACQRAAYRERETIRPPVTRALYASVAWRDLSRAVVASASACHWCHEPATARTRLTADHIARVIDRPDLALDPGNVVAACRGCQERRKHRPDVSTWKAYERRPAP